MVLKITKKQDAINYIKRHVMFDFKFMKDHKKLGIFFLIFIIILFFLLIIIKEYKNSIWINNKQLNLAVEFDNNLALVKFNRELNEISIFTIPSDTMFTVAKGFSEYQASSVKALSAQENISFGDLLKKSMTQFFGIITDGYATDYNKKNIDIEELIRLSFIGMTKTNLSKWDLMKLWFFVSSLRTENIYLVDLAQTHALNKNTMSDGAEIFERSFDFDNYVLIEMADTSFLEKELTWEIFNGTKHDGLASLFGKITKNSGFNVIGERQAKDYYDHSFLSMKDMNQIDSDIKYFATYFGLEIKEFPVLNDRADVVVVVGEDFWKENCSRE